jgi:putative tricarboxylic transport membrane protein
MKQAGAMRGMIAPVLLIATGAVTVLIGRSYSFVGSAPWAGPAVFPVVVGSGIALIGALLLLQTMREASAGQGGSTQPITLGPPILMVTVAAFILVLKPLGAPLAASILFAGTGLAFRERRIVRAALIGLVTGIVFYLVFGMALGLPIPPGPLLDRLA